MISTFYLLNSILPRVSYTKMMEKDSNSVSIFIIKKSSLSVNTTKDMLQTSAKVVETLSCCLVKISFKGRKSLKIV